MHISADAWYNAFHEAQMACASGPPADVLAVLHDLRTAAITWAQMPTSEHAAALEAAICDAGWEWTMGPNAPSEA